MYHIGRVFTSLLTLGLLSKMPAAMVQPFGWWLLDFSKDGLKKTTNIILMGAFAIFSVYLWNWVWVPWAENTYQFRLFFPTTFNEGYQQLMSDPNDLKKRFYPIALTSKISFLFCIAGLILAIVKRQYKLLLLFILSSIILIFFMLKTGRVFSGHDYYVIPFVPMMIVLAGYAISLLSKWQYLYYATLIVISIEAISYHKKDFL